MLKTICTALGLLLSAPLYAAEPIVVKLDKHRQGYSVIAFDLASRRVVWEALPCPEPNIVRHTSRGALVGCEDSIVVMLDFATGRVLWKTSLDATPPAAVTRPGRKERGFDINTYHGEHLNAYLLSDSDELYFLVGRNGENIVRCGAGACASILKKTTPYASKLIIMRWSIEPGTRGVAAIDVSAGKLAWYVNPCFKANFAEQTSAGILVGCDDANVVMLQPETGREIWRRDLAKDRALNAGRSQSNVNINRYNGERTEGFLVSDADNIYFALGKRGELLTQCEQQCAIAESPAR